mmetsp:Transcript_10112/g.17072  ORF Transcript_10112/g.17072 Transcript_10112/m.17072 type:complete len:267 (+) Transcript_10112:22-822(+)
MEESQLSKRDRIESFPPLHEESELQSLNQNAINQSIDLDTLRPPLNQNRGREEQASNGSKANSQKKPLRRYYIDWMRALCIHNVIQVHCIQNTLEATGIYDADSGPPQRLEYLEHGEGAIKRLVQGGIPIFFYISGFSLAFFDTQRKPYLFFLQGKFKRQMIPLLVCMVLILIPRLYFSQEYQEFSKVDGQIENNYLKYAFKIFPYLPLRISWLWFLPGLFINSNFSYPVLAWAQRRQREMPFSMLEDGSIVIAFLASSLVLQLSF